MNFDIPPIGGPDPGAAPPRAVTPAPRSDFATSLEAAKNDVNVSTLPASPPTEVLEQMHEAGRVAQELHDQQRELHFEPTGNGRVLVQVRDLDGNVIREIPPSRALEIAAGAALDG
jgi:uncharacterized FlaG/YvyC family protein